MQTVNWLESLSTVGSSYLLIFAAEIGDKSQLVCMTLAVKYRHVPVILGAVFAFLLLNSLAVVFGATITSFVPEIILTGVVALMFAAFGLHAFRVEEEADEIVEVKSGRNIFVAAFLLILFAEFGDKTQLAVVALSSTQIPLAVWLGSTAALISTSLLGVWAGRSILQKLPIVRLHQVSGVIFIALALFASYRIYSIW